MLVRLAHVCIETRDLEATEAFYVGLGAERRFEFRNLQEQLIGMYLHFGEDSYVELVKISGDKPEGSIAHFALQVDDLDCASEQLQNMGVSFTDKTLGGDKTWMITCHDPNGVYIELHQYTADSMQHKGGTCYIDYTP
jgi:catechol 2,3-dioxygenase-like lactoylglutathione lyase family enzyme